MYWKFRKTKVSNSIRKGRSNGRPKGTYKRFPFQETKIGCLLKWESPVLYNVIMSGYSSYYAPPVELLEYLICKVIPSFYQSKKYKKAIEEYRTLGVFCRKAYRLSDKQKRMYQLKRKKELKQYIRANFKKLNAERLMNNNRK